ANLDCDGRLLARGGETSFLDCCSFIAAGRRAGWRCQMSDRNDLRQATAKVLDPTDVDGVLSQTYYSTAAGAGSRPAEANGEKPTHHKVICISMYTEDLTRPDNMVAS